MLCNDKNIVPFKIDKTIVIDVDDKVTARKLIYNKANLTEYELDSRQDDIGTVTNCATSILNKYTKSEKKLKFYEDNISLLRIFQGKTIDSIKTGVKWYLPKVLREQLKKVPYFLLFNYPKKRDRYFKIKGENKAKGLTGANKKTSNAYHSPSPMNELCEYICRWEKETLLWNSDVASTGILLLNNKLKLKDKDVMARLRRINNSFKKDWILLLKEKDNDSSVNLDIFVNNYISELNSVVKDRFLLANYFIKVSYESIHTDKTLCWKAFSDIIIQNLILNSPRHKSSKIIRNDFGEYEYLGKRYDLVDDGGNIF